MYGDNFDDYYYYIDGVKHTLPVPYSTSGGIVYGKDEIFEAYLLSHSTLICDITNTPNMPPEVASCINRVVYPKAYALYGTAMHGSHLTQTMRVTLRTMLLQQAKIKDNAVNDSKARRQSQ